MVFRLINHFRERKYYASLPALDWRALYDLIAPHIGERPVFLELRNRDLVSLQQYVSNYRDKDVIALAVANTLDGRANEEAEAATKRIADELDRRTGFPAYALLSRNPSRFLGFYVRLGR